MSWIPGATSGAIIAATMEDEEEKNKELAKKKKRTKKILYLTSFLIGIVTLIGILLIIYLK